MKHYFLLALIISQVISTKIFFKMNNIAETLTYPAFLGERPEDQNDGFYEIKKTFEDFAQPVWLWLTYCIMAFDNNSYVFIYTDSTRPEVTMLDRDYKEDIMTYWCSPNINEEETAIIEQIENTSYALQTYGKIDDDGLGEALSEYRGFLDEFMRYGNFENLMDYIEQFYEDGYARFRYLKTNFLTNILARINFYILGKTKLVTFDELQKVLDNYGFFDNFHIKPLERFLPIGENNWGEGSTAILNLIISMYTKGQKIEDIKAFQQYLKGVDKSHYNCKTYRYSALLELEANRDVGADKEKYYDMLAEAESCNDDERRGILLDKCSFLLRESFGYKATNKCLEDVDKKYKTTNEFIYIKVLNHQQKYQSLSVKGRWKVLEANKHLKNAEQELKKCPNQGEFYFHYLQAAINLIQGKVKEFIQCLDKALEVSPYNPEVNYLRWLAGKKINDNNNDKKDSFDEEFSPMMLGTNFRILGLYTFNNKDDYNNIDILDTSYYFNLALKFNPQDFYSHWYRMVAEYILEPSDEKTIKPLITNAAEKGFIWLNEKFSHEKELKHYQYPHKHITKDYRSLYSILEVYLNKYLGAYDVILNSLNPVKPVEVGQTAGFNFPGKKYIGNLLKPHKESKKAPTNVLTERNERTDSSNDEEESSGLPD
jgi:hypothetical protein